MLFDGLREVVSAFRLYSPPSDIAEQVDAVRTLSREQGQMGFFRRKPGSEAAKAVARTLRERGKAVTDAEAERTAAYLKAEEERSAIRRRFAMQALISCMVLGFAVGSLTLGTVSEASSKALFGLIGTIVGYWLR